MSEELSNARNERVNLRARVAYENAFYVFHRMGVSYSPDSGEITIVDPENVRFQGSPSVVLDHPEFFIPGMSHPDGIRRDEKLIDLAFEIGYLIGKRLGKEETNG